MTPVLAVAGPSAYWYLARGTGVVSMLLLTVSVVLGILNAERFALAPRLPRFAVDRLHRDVSLLVVAVLVVHIITSVLDSFAHIAVTDAVLPLGSAYRPLWLGLGALGFDLLIAVTLTSLLRRRLGHRAWRAVHWLAYVSWPVAIFHGLGTGSDANSGWLLILTAVCVLAVVGAVVARVLGHRDTPLSAAWLLLAAATPVAVAVFAIAGPLSPHWARRAGTPAALLGKTHRVFASTPAAAPAPRTRPGFPIPFTAQLHGTVRQIPQPGGALVDLVLRCSGDISGEMRVRMAGAPIPGGGLSMTGSQVELTALGMNSAFQGKIVSLQGQQFDAHVRDAAGTRLTLHADLQIDNSTDTVDGTLTATTGA